MKYTYSFVVVMLLVVVDLCDKVTHILQGCFTKNREVMMVPVWVKLTTFKYRQVSNIRHTLVGNRIVDHSDVIGASPVGAAPTTSSFST